MRLSFDQIEEQIAEFSNTLSKIDNRQMSFRAANPFPKLTNDSSPLLALYSDSAGVLSIWDFLTIAEVNSMATARSRFPILQSHEISGVLFIALFENNEIIGFEPFTIEAICMVLSSISKPTRVSPLFDE